MKLTEGRQLVIARPIEDFLRSLSFSIREGALDARPYTCIHGWSLPAEKS